MRLPHFVLALAVVSSLGFQGARTTPDKLRAQAAYDAVHAKFAKAKSLKMQLEVHSLDRVDKYDFSFLRDNYAKIVSPESMILQNGRTYYDYNPKEKEYWTRPAPSRGLPQGTAFSLGGLVGLERIGFNNEPRMVATKVISKKWQGEDAKAISLEGDLDPKMKATLYVSAKTGLPTGWEFVLHDFKSSGRFKNVVLDAPMKPANFAWTPPPGSKKID